MRWKNYLTAASKWLISAQFTSFLRATAAGIALVFGLSLAIGTVGFSLWAVAGLVLAAAIGLDCAWRTNTVSSLTNTLFKVAIVAWVCVSPVLADAAFSLSGSLLQANAASSVGVFLTGLLVGLVALAFPCFLTAVSFGSMERSRLAPCLGLAVGIVAAPLFPVAVLGAQLVALIAVGTAAVFDAAHQIFGVAVVVETDAKRSSDASVLPKILAYVGMAIAGASVAIIGRVLNQTMPSSLQVIACGLATVLVGTLIGYRYFSRSVGWTTGIFAMLSVSVASVFVLYPEIVGTQLAINAEVSLSPAVFALRGLLAAVLIFPAGLVFGGSLNSLQAGRSGFPTVVVGCGVVCMWLLMPVVGTPVLGLGLIAMVCVTAIVSSKTNGQGWLPKTTIGWVAIAGCVAATAATPFGSARYDTELSSQLLFSSAVFREYASGTEPHLLLATSDGRQLANEETPNGIRSVWRHAGSRIQVRQNGIPVSVTSTSVTTCPQSAAAVMPVVLPLLLHEATEHVLLLGDAGPAAEATSLMFPISSLTTLGDRNRTAGIVDEHFSARHADDRFNQIVADANIGLSGIAGQFDVIVSRPPQPALPAAAPYYSPAFHARVAARLTENGLFCQSFNQTDFGANPLSRVLTSLRGCFKSVSAIQVDGSELLLVATNGDAVIRPGLAMRSSRGHVRRILAELGWDWSRVLQLACLDQEATEAIADSSPGMNSASNAAFLWGLPLETMSWKNKALELQASIAPYERSVLTQLEQDDYRDEAGRRIKEASQEVEILFGFPDEPWMYRKSLRTRMEQHSRPPREVVERGAVKRKPHPVDQYRIDYFKSLAEAVKAVKTGGSKEAAVAQLSQFTTPTEPLVSYFANHEVVRLLEAGDLSPSTEFQHRLHTIYFVPGLTRSVREVVAAMNLLVEHPEVIPDPADRWDQMNSLLQILMGRWAARRDIPPRSSHVALNDIEKSLLAIESGLKAMNNWRSEAQINVELCDNREVFLRRRLERPLRRYREELLPHHDKQPDQQIADDEVVDQFRYLGN